MKKLIAVVMLCFCAIFSTGCSTLQNRDLAVKAAYGSVIADVASTKYVLQQGCVEANPLLGSNPNDAVLIGNLLLSAGVVRWLDTYIEDKTVVWPFWAISVIRGGAAVHNSTLNCN